MSECVRVLQAPGDMGGVEEVGMIFWFLSDGFMGADFIFRLYNLHTGYILFCKKIKKIKHITINIMITWGIFPCTV